MIYIDFNWSEIGSQATLGLLILLLIAYLWFVFRRSGGRSSPRFWTKFSLHILLWLSLLGLVLKPYWNKTAQSGTALVFGKDVPVVFSNQIKDSLQTAEMLDISKPDFSQTDSLILVGQDFPQSVFEGIMLSKYQPSHIQWIPHNSVGNVKNLAWKGILRQGEIQQISGVLSENKGSLLKLRYGNTVIDSILVKAGEQVFNFSFPAFSNGGIQMTLESGGNTIDTIRFYTRKLEPLKFRFLLESPDFESRTLASWLGKNGHSVDYVSTLSKNMVSDIKINDPGEPDILVVDPQNLGSASVRKYLGKGKSLLVINLENPLTEINQINKTFETRFQVKADTKDSTTKNVSETVLPFHFLPASYQIPLSKWPVTGEKKSGIVAVSLLNETYPMILSGDSLRYGRIWSEILAGLRPAMRSNVDFQSPVYEGVEKSMTLNNFSPMPNLLKIGGDTVFLSTSAINPLTAGGKFTIRKSGWVSFSDSLELYVEGKTAPEYKSAYLVDFLRKYQIYQTAIQKSDAADKFPIRTARKDIPDWVWFTLILCALLGIWIEEKI